MTHKFRCAARNRLVCAAVAAAVAGPSMMAPATAADGLDEIIVTARKREENLQDVPLSISAITAGEIERLNVNTTEDVAKYDSSVIFDEGYGATDTRIVIRGLSPTRGRTNVALLVDNVNVSSESVSFGGGGMLATSRLLDLERVEIVKGPQSVLYGRGAFAGAISYVTKDPGSALEANVRTDIAEYGQEEVGFAVGGLVTDTLGLRFNAVVWDEDGFFREFARGRKVGGGEGWGAALTGKWEPADTLTVRARVEHSDDHYDPSATVSLRSNYAVPRPADGTVDPDGAGPLTRVYGPGTVIGYVGGVPKSSRDLQVTYSENPFGEGTWDGSDRKYTRGSLTLSWQVLSGTLSSITGYTDAEFAFREDGDFDAEFAPGAVAGNANDISPRATAFQYANTTRQLSEELRYQSDLDGSWQFAASALYWRDDVRQIGQSISMFCFPSLAGFLPPGSTCATANGVIGAVQTQPRLDGHEVEHISAGLLVEWQATERLKFAAEARYAEEDETTTGQVCRYSVYGPACIDPTWPPFLGPAPAIFGPSINLFFDPARQGLSDTVELQSKSSYTTPRFSAEFRLTDDMLFYASAAKGVKPGGFSTVAAGAWSDNNYDGNFDEIKYGPEKLWAYEAGAKVDWLEGRLRTNAALYFQDYEGKQTGAQVITPSGIANGRILNAGSAEIKGLELTTMWAPSANWMFSLNYTYTDAEYTDFVFNSNSPTDAVRAGSVCNPETVTNDAGQAARLCRIDLAGNTLEDVPEHSGVLLARYENDLVGTSLRWYVEGDVEAQGKRFVDQFNRRFVHGYEEFNLRVGVRADNWEALLYVNNVGDDRTIRSATDSPGDVDAALTNGEFSFSPADNLTVRLTDPRFFGVRVNYRFGE